MTYYDKGHTSAAEAVAFVLDSYPGLGGWQRSSWAVWSNGFTIQASHKCEACHAGMKNDPSGCDNLVTCYKIVNLELDTRFFNFMRNVMYAPYAEHISLVKDDLTGLHYIMITNLDKVPANVVYNLCITSRIIFEFREQLNVWASLCDKGLDPRLAFLFMGSDACSSLDIQVDGLFDEVSNTNHWPVDQLTDVSTFLSGKYSQLSPSFKSTPTQCFPSNVIWHGPTGSPGLQELEDTTIRNFCKEHHEDLLQPPG